VTDPGVADIADRLETLATELRRQGRAAVAAQAAAESCLTAVERLETRMAEVERTEESRGDDEVLPALFPLFDALMRVVGQAEGLESDAGPRWPLSLLHTSKNPARLQSLQHAVRLLGAALDQTMDHLGIVIERRVGISLDPVTHRVVEARAPRVGEAPDTVVEVRRCGYLKDGRVLREADVVATRSVGR
jgi:molecular chaperone GrpE (heat shock protein)